MFYPPSGAKDPTEAGWNVPGAALSPGAQKTRVLPTSLPTGPLVTLPPQTLDSLKSELLSFFVHSDSKDLPPPHLQVCPYFFVVQATL